MAIRHIPDAAIDELLGRGLSHRQWRIVIEGRVYGGCIGGRFYIEWQRIWRHFFGCRSFFYTNAVKDKVIDREFDMFRSEIEYLLLQGYSVRSIAKRLKGEIYTVDGRQEQEDRWMTQRLFGCDTRTHTFKKVTKKWAAEKAMELRAIRQEAEAAEARNAILRQQMLYSPVTPHQPGLLWIPGGAATSMTDQPSRDSYAAVATAALQPASQPSDQTRAVSMPVEPSHTYPFEPYDPHARWTMVSLERAIEQRAEEVRTISAIYRLENGVQLRAQEILALKTNWANMQTEIQGREREIARLESEALEDYDAEEEMRLLTPVDLRNSEEHGRHIRMLQNHEFQLESAIPEESLTELSETDPIDEMDRLREAESAVYEDQFDLENAIPKGRLFEQTESEPIEDLSWLEDQSDLENAIPRESLVERRRTQSFDERAWFMGGMLQEDQFDLENAIPQGSLVEQTETKPVNEIDWLWEADSDMLQEDQFDLENAIPREAESGMLHEDQFDLENAIRQAKGEMLQEDQFDLENAIPRQGEIKMLQEDQFDLENAIRQAKGEMLQEDQFDLENAIPRQGEIKMLQEDQFDLENSIPKESLVKQTQTETTEPVDDMAWLIEEERQEREAEDIARSRRRGRVFPSTSPNVVLLPALKRVSQRSSKIPVRVSSLANLSHHRNLSLQSNLSPQSNLSTDTTAPTLRDIRRRDTDGTWSSYFTDPEEEVCCYNAVLQQGTCSSCTALEEARDSGYASPSSAHAWPLTNKVVNESARLDSVREVVEGVEG